MNRSVLSPVENVLGTIGSFYGNGLRCVVNLCDCAMCRGNHVFHGECKRDK